MRLILLIFITSVFTAQVKHDTIIDRGIYRSYFNLSIKEPVTVTYTLFHGGGEASRKNDRFKDDTLKITLTGEDYSKSGYDRGHLAAAEDFAYSDSLQGLTFSYFNCVPQTPELNRGKWKKYEEYVRELSKKDTVVIVCYNEYNGTKSGSLNIPDVCYKTVYKTSGELLFSIGIANSVKCEEISISDKIFKLMKGFLN